VPDPLLLGNRLTYSVIVHNLGPDVARDLQLSVNLPDGLGPLTVNGAACIGQRRLICNLGHLNLGQRINIQIGTTPQAPGTVMADFALTSSTPDLNSSNNVVATSTTVSGRPLLSASVTGQTGSGTTLTVQLTFRNIGSEAAVNAVINRLESRVLSGSGVVAVTHPGTPVTLGRLEVGQSVTISVTLHAPESALRITLAEAGVVTDALGRSYAFSIGQGVNR
jgi:hypothetical protein